MAEAATRDQAAIEKLSEELGWAGAPSEQEADVLALKATIKIINSLLELLAVHDLGGALNAMVQLESFSKNLFRNLWKHCIGWVCSCNF